MNDTSFTSDRPDASARPINERLAFNDRRGGRWGSSIAGVPLPSNRVPTFATAAFAEARDWGYVGLFAFTAVLLLRPQDQIPGLTSLHLAELCALIGIGPMLLHRIAYRQPVFKVNPETIALFLFGMVMLAGVPTSVWPSGALAEFSDKYLKIVVVFLLMMNTLTTPARLDRLMWLILLCVGVIAANSLANYAQGINLVEGGRLAGPIGGIFGNPNDLALNMVTFLPLAGIVALSRHRPAWRRIVAVVVAALMVATIVLTRSRGGALGLAVALAALMFLGRKIRPGFAIIATLSLLAAAPMLPASFWARMNSIVDADEDARMYTGSRAARSAVMQEGINTFLDHPVTGVGVGQFKNYNPPGRQQPWLETHNAIIQVAAETGAVGVFIFLFLIVRAATAAMSARRMLGERRIRAPENHGVLSPSDRQDLYEDTIALSAGLAGWFVCALFASVAYNWTFYYLLALIVAARELVRDRRRAMDASAEVVARPSRFSSAARVFPARSTGIA